jgi:hypothetical protein
MKYLKADLIADVTKEAKALRENATEAELNNLTILINPYSFRGCIYGQMTGDCRSPRASELIFQCCTRYFHNGSEAAFLHRGMAGVRRIVNGEKIEGAETPKELKDKRGSSVRYLSSIETYIATPRAKIDNLVAYLKHHTNDLNL